MSAPSETDPDGWLVVLHGHDSSAAEADALARSLDPAGRFHHVVPEGPIATDSGGREWFSSTPGSLATARALLAGLLDDLRAAGGPIVVVGYSQGAAAALATLTAPGGPTVAAVACLSGYLPDEAGLEHDPSRLAGTDVLVQHGRVDDVVPDFLAVDLATLLEGAGVPLTTQFFEMGHERTDESLGAVRAWLDGVPAA